MKITFQKIQINLHDLCAIFLLTSITCCFGVEYSFNQVGIIKIPIQYDSNIGEEV
jgi:hypothetical protein